MTSGPVLAGPLPLDLPAPLRALGVVAAGAVLGLAFAPVQVWLAVPLGLGAFTVFIAGRRVRAAAGYGYLFGLGLCTVAISWLSGLGWWIAALLVLAMSGFFAAYGAGLRLVLRLPWWPVWAAGVWSLLELWYSHWPFGGFGWIRLGYTVLDTPFAGLLSLIGVPGLGFVVPLLVQLTVALVDAIRRRRAVGRALVVGVLAYSLAIGVALVPALAPAPPSQGTVTIGLVQGNVDGVNPLEPFGRARSVTNNHLSETVTLMAKARAGVVPSPDFVVWPENSTDIDPLIDDETNAVIRAAIGVTGTPILVGAVTDGPGPDERQTGGLWWGTDNQVTQRYYKRNLVPFGEFIPFRDVLLPRVPILALTGRQSVPGTRPGVFDVRLRDGRSIVVGDAICFELAYDATIYDTVRNRAQVLVVQSNNASYNGTPQPEQQWTMTRARAIETGRDVVVATTSSVSGVIRADGTVVSKSRPWRAYSTAATLQLRGDLTPAVVIGPWLGVGFALVGAVAVLVATVGAVAGWRRRRGGRLGDVGHTGGVGTSTKPAR